MILALTVTTSLATEFPTNEDQEILGYDAGRCESGVAVIVIFYNSRVEFYLENGTLFGVHIKGKDFAYVLQKDGSIKEENPQVCDAADRLS